jgi:molecular chaperone DnaK
MKMGLAIYSQEQASAHPTDGAAAGGSEGGAEEEVVDAEFSEVDEDAKS